MTLLAPALALLGAAGLALPVLAHLLGRPRPRVVPLATMRFLPRADPAITHRRRLTDPGLLLVRLALLAVLALIWMRPSRPQESALSVLGEPHDAVLLWDATASMGLVVEGASLQERALRRARELVDALPAGTRLGLASTDPTLTPVAPGAGTPASLLATLQSRTQDRTPTRADPLPDALDRARALLPDEGRPRAIYVLSDRTRGGLGSLPRARPEPVRVIPLPVPARAPEPPVSQVAITKASWTPAPDLDPLAVRLEVEVEAYPPLEEGATIPVELLLDDTVTARADATLRGGAGQVTFTHTLTEARPVAATVRIDRPQDPLPVDDRRALWLSADDTVDVMLVDGAPSDLRIHDEVFFLSTALSSVPPPPTLSLHTLAPGQLAERLREDADALDEMDVLILANAPAPPEDVAPAILRAVEGGLGLLVTVGDRVDPRAYMAALGPLMPLPLREAVQVGTLPGRSQAQVEPLAPPDLTHPLLAGFPSASGLGGGRTRHLMLLEPLPGGPAQVALAFASGAPALVTRPVGRGQVALLTTTVDLDWTDLPLRPGFAPLMHRLVTWLGTGGGTTASGTQVQVGASRTIRADGPVTVSIPDGSTRVVVPDREGRLVFTHTDEPGHYRVRDAKDREVDLFAVGVDAAESDVTAVWDEAAHDPADADLRTVTTWDPAWRPLWLLATLLLALESALRLRARGR